MKILTVTVFPPTVFVDVVFPYEPLVSPYSNQAFVDAAQLTFTVPLSSGESDVMLNAEPVVT